MNEKKNEKKEECCDLEACCNAAPKILRQIADAIEKCCGPKDEAPGK
jgi:hypothetical protein